MSQTATIVGPADNGRRMSLAEFDRVETRPGYLYELARGVIVVSDVPNLPHMAQVDELRQALAVHRAQHPNQIRRILSGSDCKLLLGDLESERHPDIAVYKTAPPDDENVWAVWVPALVIEVVSPGSENRDYVEKREEYLAFGVREYWIVDAARGEILVPPPRRPEVDRACRSPACGISNEDAAGLHAELRNHLPGRAGSRSLIARPERNRTMSQTATIVGPADNGRRMSLAEFDHVETRPGYVYELGRGVIVVSDIPSLPHLAQVNCLRRQLVAYDLAHPGTIHTIAASGECKLLVGDLESERHPDIAVYKTAPPHVENVWAVWVPALVIEVVSPGGEDRDYVEKREEYLAFGVREYWIVDAARGEITVLRRVGRRWTERVVRPPAAYQTKVLPGFTLSCETVFQAAREAGA